VAEGRRSPLRSASRQRKPPRRRARRVSTRLRSFMRPWAASVFIALSPALLFAFGYHNDFNAWAYDTRTCCTRHPETQMLLGIGGYFAAYAENLQFHVIHGLRDFWLWRLVGAVSTALLAVYYLHIVSLRRPPMWTNACLTIALFTLPTMRF
jgi:hypothetical protein